MHKLQLIAFNLIQMQQFYQDGARIEAGFRKYFHRANAKQDQDSHTLIVCHANVIRYFVCRFVFEKKKRKLSRIRSYIRVINGFINCCDIFRALQIPAEAWLRISLNHASITWISIQPSGRVTLRLLGDSGHIPPELVTSR